MILLTRIQSTHAYLCPMRFLKYRSSRRLCAIIFFLIFSITSDIRAQSFFENTNKTDPQLVNWLKANVSNESGLPFSFQVSPALKAETYSLIGKPESVTGIIERLIVAEGTSVYDTALWQITLTMLGGDENLKSAARPVEIYWEGSLNDLQTIRAGYLGQPFVYNPEDPWSVTSNNAIKGQRGFVFRILNAHGNYLMTDPLNGRKDFRRFPNLDRIHWEDWKPIAGENAWIILGALHLYHKKHYRSVTESYQYHSMAEELRLAEEIARAGLMLQSETGGIRMAPIGTYYHLLSLNEDCPEEEIIDQLDESAEQFEINPAAAKENVRMIAGIAYPAYHTWYFDEISTENNLSWYAALRLLYRITGREIYKNALEDIERYFKTVWSPSKNTFYQGMHFTDGVWRPNTKFFATDVQNWGIIVIGPEKIDEWFGEGAAFRVWQATKKISGSFNAYGQVRGVGFTAENDRISIEWTCGAIFATRALYEYYKNSHPDWAEEAWRDGVDMRKGIEAFRKKVTKNSAAYSYSSRRGWIPFGWFSHDPEVLSLVSTCWVILTDANFNPFELPSE